MIYRRSKYRTLTIQVVTSGKSISAIHILRFRAVLILTALNQSITVEDFTAKRNFAQVDRGFTRCSSNEGRTGSFDQLS